MVKDKEFFLNPVEGLVTSSFGERVNPVLDKVEYHNGIDIAVPMGTEVRAVKSGVVDRVRVSDTYGLVLEYTTRDGYQVMYAHLAEVLVAEGEPVEQKQVVALSGNSGMTTGAHLHYTLSKDGGLVDPLAYVELSYSVEVAQEMSSRKELQGGY